MEELRPLSGRDSGYRWKDSGPFMEELRPRSKSGRIPAMPRSRCPIPGRAPVLLGLRAGLTLASERQKRKDSGYASITLLNTCASSPCCWRCAPG